MKKDILIFTLIFLALNLSVFCQSLSRQNICDIVLNDGTTHKYILLSEDEKFLKVVQCDSSKTSQDTSDFFYIDKKNVKNINRLITPLKSDLLYPEVINEFSIIIEGIFDRSNINPLLILDIDIWNKSDTLVEIQEIVLKDRNQYMLFPLSPEGVAYVYLDIPPAEIPFSSFNPSPKKFIVTGNMTSFEIEEKKSFMDRFIEGAVLGQKIYKEKYKRKFEAIIRDVVDNSFKIDKIFPSTKIKGTFYYRIEPYDFPLELDIYFENSDRSFFHKYKIECLF